MRYSSRTDCANSRHHRSELTPNAMHPQSNATPSPHRHRAWFQRRDVSSRNAPTTIPSIGPNKPIKRARAGNIAANRAITRVNAPAANHHDARRHADMSPFDKPLKFAGVGGEMSNSSADMGMPFDLPLMPIRMTSRGVLVTSKQSQRCVILRRAQRCGPGDVQAPFPLNELMIERDFAQQLDKPINGHRTHPLKCSAPSDGTHLFQSLLQHGHLMLFQWVPCPKT